ncbi:hypothetical protein ARMSODRAFT_983141 [Armillaria solidipes]|uniref:Uncharacterized protein n=1 Tax=Armillaria solidipes TaxID=1076256 RepID=A0A2H3B406_9AGAR|nr:hypothetical protein ARMSODRAFT_983141 [Armillaria solidipes]
MATQSTIPPDLTDSDIASIVEQLDVALNAGIFDSQLNGIYTGVVTVMLWNILHAEMTVTVTNKSRPIGWLMTIITILLYITTMINYGISTWSFLHSIFVVNAQSFWTEFQGGTDAGALILEAGIPSAICSILADAIMIWRCWIVWGQRSLIILIPSAFLVSATACKILSLYKEYVSQGITTTLLPLLYSSFVLVTTLCCTLLIIFRIVTVAWAAAFDVQDNVLFSYFDSLAAFARGIAPTLLIGRVAAGHARPDDSWQGSVLSSLHFGGHHEGSTTQTISHQKGSLANAILDSELGVQQEKDTMSCPIVLSSQEDAILESVIQQDDLEAQSDRPTGNDSGVILLTPRNL